MADFPELLELAKRLAEHVLVGTKKQLPPTWLLFSNEGENSIEVTPWRNEFERNLYLASVRQVIRERGVVAYVVLSEAWLARHDVKPGEGIPINAPPPRLDPKRREVVIGMVVDRARRKDGRIWPIVRDYKGSIQMLRDDAERIPALVGGALVETMFDG